MNSPIPPETQPLIASPGIRTYWNPGRASWIASVGPGEFCVVRDGLILSTVLGSCIAACIYEPEARVGGLNHFLLPLGKVGEPAAAAMRYGAFAMERLINEILKNGGVRRNLKAKIFGGGRLLGRQADVGGENIAFARSYLHDEGLTIVAEDVGGDFARKLEFYPADGRARVKKLVGDRRAFEEESGYLKRADQPSPPDGGIELF